MVTDAAGQNELFAVTRSGGLDYAWRAAGTGRWTWGAPLAGGSTGQRVRRTPAAVRWPDGLVRVYAQLASGKLGVIGAAGHRWRCRLVRLDPDRRQRARQPGRVDQRQRHPGGGRHRRDPADGLHQLRRRGVERMDRTSAAAS